MIKLENFEVVGWEHAIRGMRNPKNSWDKSDSGEGCLKRTIWGKSDEGLKLCENCSASYDSHCVCQADDEPAFCIGPNDHKLMMQLAKGGPVHAKYRRMITVYVDITAPLYWWKEFDTYKVGTVMNSCSTMHKIHDKEFTVKDFSYEHLVDTMSIEPECPELLSDVTPDEDGSICFSPAGILGLIVRSLNLCREAYLKTKDKKYWWQLIQLLPSSYNQKRTVMLNYEVLAGIYPMRKNHKLDEWHDFCAWIDSLPYSEIITGPSLDDIPISHEIMAEAERRVRGENNE